MVECGQQGDTHMAIHNCHIHLFNLENVPDGFVHPWMMEVAKMDWSRNTLVWIMRHLGPFSHRDLPERCARLLAIAGSGKQADSLKTVQSYYPSDTRFVVLPMDMSEMGAGNVGQDIYKQHEELALVRDANPDAVIPFAAIDPRRADVMQVLEHAVEKLGFKGIKLYPALGYHPTHDILMTKVYPYCLDHHLSVMTHCSKGGVRQKGISKENASKFTDPYGWKTVLTAFPGVNFCLGHFGGIDDWRSYLDTPWPQDGSPQPEQSWLAKIIDMMRSGKYQNLYADISYTAFSLEVAVDLLKVLLADPRIRPQVLFGSDFYMAEKEKITEREMVIKLRSALGEDLFWQIAEINPKRYLS